VLARHGGVYVDTDVECRRPLTPLLRGVKAFAALEAPGRAGNAILGSVPGHRFMQRAARLCRRTLGTGPDSPTACGPYLVSLILEQEPDVTIFGSELFYPYTWLEPERAGEEFPRAYTIHRWNGSWLKQATAAGI
jgi:mannosyltransferase OCH1-like enzyme